MKMSATAPKTEEEAQEGPKDSNSVAVHTPLPRSHRTFFLAQSILRALAAASALVSVVVLVSDKQSVLIFGMRFEAHYNYSSAFRFLVGVDSVAIAFSVLSLMFLCYLRRSEPNFRHHFFLFLHDLVIMVLMIAGCSAASAVGYIGRYGEEKMGWLGVCDKVSKFCNRSLASVILSYLAFFCYFALTISSAHKLALVSVRVH